MGESVRKRKLKQLDRLLSQAETYSRISGKMMFDMQVCAPPEGLEQASLDMAELGKLPFRILHSKKYITLITELHQDPEGLTFAERKLIDYLWSDYGKTKNMTPQFAFDMETVGNRAYADWLKAKKAKDFSLFRDSFAALVSYTQKSIDLRDEKKATCYDTCLDDFERGGSIAQLDAFFDALKQRILPLIREIGERGKPIRSDFLTRRVAVARQEAFNEKLLAREGLRREALVLMTTEHPFTDNYGPHDVRVTTHYYEDNFISNLFSILHEGGHALFMQNEPEDYHTGHIANRMSYAMHECVSRFYENLIGRSEAFIHSIWGDLQSDFGDVLSDVSESEFYEAVNIAKPQLIRTEADELTYSVHILIRYELEKQFMNGEITVDEVPAAWNQKYKEYLGLDVPDDAQGVLQDVHWAGSYGYFPSYALGSAYGAQILATMNQEFDVDAAVASGNLKKVSDWMISHVFARASVETPDEWIREITGEALNPSYFLDYLERKFRALYSL